MTSHTAAVCPGGKAFVLSAAEGSIPGTDALEVYPLCDSCTWSHENDGTTEK